MKSKFTRILGVVAVIALLASFLAAPVLADVDNIDVDIDDNEISADSEYVITFDVTDELGAVYSLRDGGGTAEWSDDYSKTGDYSVKLYDGGVADQDGAQVIIPGGSIALDQLLTSGDLSYWFRYTSATGSPADGADAFPYMILAIDTGGGNTVDEWIVLHSGGDAGAPAESTTFEQWTITLWDKWFDVVGDEISDFSTLEQVSSAYPDADVVDVKVAVGEGWAVGVTAYVDDITINGTTYDLETDGLDIGTITIEFPEGTEVAATGDWANDDITVQSSESLWGGDGNLTPVPVGFTAVTTEDPDDVYTVTIGLGPLEYNIAEGTTVMVTFLNGITNPDTAGDYTLWVSTSAEDDPVESEEYEIEVPDVDVLPGIVEVYNPSDILMDSFTGTDAIADAFAVTSEGWTIKIGEGEYPENPDTGDLEGGDGANKVTIEGSGDVEDIVIVGNWAIAHEDITIDGLTLDGNLTVTDDDFILQNCVVDDGGTLRLAGDATDAKIKDTIFNVEDEVGIEVDEDDAVITDCTFNIEDGGVGISVEVGGTDTDVSGSTFTGDEGEGVGIEVTDALSVLDVEGSTFDVLETAFEIDAGTVNITGNTIQNCEGIAFDIDGAKLVTIHNNTITGNDDAELVDVDATGTDDHENVFIMFNTITDNDGDDGLLIDNNDSDGEDLECRNNWWGDADGPGDDAFSDDVESEPFLPGPISASFIETGILAGETADFEDDCGVQVDNDDTNGEAIGIVGAAQYTENPVAAISNAVGFWDICVVDAPAGVTIRLYTDVTKYTEVHVWGAARGEWLEASNATFNLFGGFMSIVVTDNTTPTLDDLGALPFVVVDSGEGAADAVEITAPDVGAVDVSTTPTLAWTVEDGATYEVQIAQDATFAILDEAATSPTNAYIVTTALAEGQSYYWRVRAVTDAGAGDWATGVFTTAIPEPEKEPPIVIEDVGPPEITVTMPAAEVTQAIDPALLWAIIGVGAVLVISLIVLIVRTRRAV